MDYAKNLQNLSRMIEAVTNGEVKKIGNRKLSSFENVEKMAGHGVQYLSKLEEKMVNLLLEQVKNGKSLVTQYMGEIYFPNSSSHSSTGMPPQ